MQDNQQLTSSPETIKANIRRIWGTIQGASKKTGISRQALYKIIYAGEVSDFVAGKLLKLGVAPSELIKPVK